MLKNMHNNIPMIFDYYFFIGIQHKSPKCSKQSGVSETMASLIQVCCETSGSWGGDEEEEVPI